LTIAKRTMILSAAKTRDELILIQR
jgi:hypothetical protein